MELKFSVIKKNEAERLILVTASYDGLLLSKSITFYWLKRLSKKAGVHDIKVHALRHSHVALLISLKEAPLVIKERLGHSKIETTLGTYGHFYPKQMNAVAERLSELDI